MISGSHVRVIKRTISSDIGDKDTCERAHVRAHTRTYTHTHTLIVAECIIRDGVCTVHRGSVYVTSPWLRWLGS